MVLRNIVNFTVFVNFVIFTIFITLVRPSLQPNEYISSILLMVLGNTVNFAVCKHFWFTGCLARDQNLPTVSDKIYWRFICEWNLYPRMNLTGFRLNMAYTLELNISHIIEKLPKTSCVMVAIYIVVDDLFVRRYRWASAIFVYILMDINTL